MEVLTPAEPPNYFGDDIPSSILSTATTTEISGRSTKSSSASVRNSKPCEMPKFNSEKQLIQEKFKDQITDKITKINGHISWTNNDKSFLVFSESRNGPVHSFSIYCHYTSNDIHKDIIKDVSYEAYMGLQRFKHPLFKHTFNGWEQLDVLLHSLQLSAEEPEDDTTSPHFGFIENQIKLLNTDKNKRIYTTSDMCQAFRWYSTSRTLYKQLRLSMKLPSISTLQRVTRIAKNMADEELFTAFFYSQEERSRGCVLIVDEVYVKTSLTYSGEWFLFFLK